MELDYRSLMWFQANCSFKVLATDPFPAYFGEILVDIGHAVFSVLTCKDWNEKNTSIKSVSGFLVLCSHTTSSLAQQAIMRVCFRRHCTASVVQIFIKTNRGKYGSRCIYWILGPKFPLVVGIGKHRYAIPAACVRETAIDCLNGKNSHNRTDIKILKKVQYFVIT